MKGASDAILRPEQATYLEGLEPARDALLAEMEKYAAEHREPISDPEVASFLAVTTRLAQPKRIVEVGTNIGYSAIVLARAAGPDAKVTTIELNPELVRVSRDFIRRAGLADRVTVEHGDALEVLDALQGDVDLAYIDCIKEHYVDYLDRLLPRLSSRGAIIADNVLWKGLTAAADADVPAKEKSKVTALRAFNAKLLATPGLRGVVLPLGDGVAYAVRA